jgi:hypothetical protein
MIPFKDQASRYASHAENYWNNVKTNWWRTNEMIYKYTVPLYFRNKRNLRYLDIYNGDKKRLKVENGGVAAGKGSINLCKINW